MTDIFNNADAVINNSQIDGWPSALEILNIVRSNVSGQVTARVRLELRVDGQSSIANLVGFADFMAISTIDGQSTVLLNQMNSNRAVVRAINGQSSLDAGVIYGPLEVGLVDGSSGLRATAASISFVDKIDGRSNLTLTQSHLDGSTYFGGKIDGASSVDLSCAGEVIYFNEKIDGGSALTVTTLRTDGKGLFIKGPEISGNSTLTLIGDNIFYDFGQVHYGGKIVGGTRRTYPM